MLCQSCEKRQASTHIKTILSGELKEYNLCPECAAKLGYGSIFTNFGFDIDKLFGSFMDSDNIHKKAKRCQFCGSSFDEIAKSGKVGCAHCYELFADQLYPSIRRIHGNTTHCGKNSGKQEAPEQKPAEMTKEQKISELKKQLDKAVSEQNFERAAELRDEIKETEASK